MLIFIDIAKIRSPFFEVIFFAVFMSVGKSGKGVEYERTEFVIGPDDAVLVCCACLC